MQIYGTVAVHCTRVVAYDFVVQFYTAMGKATQRRIDFVLKRKRDDFSEVGEDPLAAADDPLPLLELEQQQQNHVDGLHTNEPVIFRGVEFLQRDPGLRPQIWQYPPDQRDSVSREYLLLGPMQPRLQNYKLSGEEEHRRRFQFNWFGLFPSWLEYSRTKIVHIVYFALCPTTRRIHEVVRMSLR